MRNVYVVTMWTGDGPTRKWKSHEMPALLPQGTGVEFVNAETRLKVQVIGNISIEEYESGKEEIESMRSDWVTLPPSSLPKGGAMPTGGASPRQAPRSKDEHISEKAPGERDRDDDGKRGKGIRRLF